MLMRFSHSFFIQSALPNFSGRFFWPPNDCSRNQIHAPCDRLGALGTNGATAPRFGRGRSSESLQRVRAEQSLALGIRGRCQHSTDQAIGCADRLAQDNTRLGACRCVGRYFSGHGRRSAWAQRRSGPFRRFGRHAACNRWSMGGMGPSARTAMGQCAVGIAEKDKPAVLCRRIGSRRSLDRADQRTENGKPELTGFWPQLMPEA